MDYESLIVEIVEEHEKSARSLWKCAELVYLLYDKYGVYERDFTAVLSSQMRVGVDTLYHWRKAWVLRLRVLEAIPDFDLSGLSISHFYLASDYVERMGLDWVADWLGVAQESAWSSRRLASEMCAACDDSGSYGWLVSKLGLSADRLRKLYDNSELAGLPDKKRCRLRRVILLLDGLIK